jgi:hypothetical protein
MTRRPFDIVDFILCEIYDVIHDGLTVARHMTYAQGCPGENRGPVGNYKVGLLV